MREAAPPPGWAGQDRVYDGVRKMKKNRVRVTVPCDCGSGDYMSVVMRLVAEMIAAGYDVAFWDDGAQGVIEWEE